MTCIPVRHLERCELPEAATAVIRATIRDDAEEIIPAGSLDSVVATIYDEKSGEILNSRDHVDVLNTNGGSVDVNGVLALRLDPEDMVIVNDARASELHICLLEWEWTAGFVTFYGKAEIAFTVKNLAQVPAAS